jgi:nicotinate-nucleotide adenylyltransferase
LAAKIGILGGTFDPIHRGHLRLAAEVRRKLGLGRVVLIPAAAQPLKAGRHGASVEDRLQMCALAAEGEPWLGVSDVEARTEGPSYTVDTLRTLRAALGPRTRIYFIAGADVLADLPRWRAVDEVLALATFVVATRPGHALDLAPLAGRIDAARIVPVEVDALPVSSTEVRRRLAEGEPLGDLLPPRVAEYIRAHGLYDESKERLEK